MNQSVKKRNIPGTNNFENYIAISVPISLYFGDGRGEATLENGRSVG